MNNDLDILRPEKLNPIQSAIAYEKLSAYVLSMKYGYISRVTEKLLEVALDLDKGE